ncbi:unnamed protein product [Cuscuta epithymum]|uniref:Uncharacterized protein n=1 Tax=Cuscuta epithymum TaxID=186058 RepID=A0AAV0DVQ2_9ASTE|nr:unnamed protein product [Cuscuta epithymum]
MAAAGKMIFSPLPGGGYVQLREGYSNLDLLAAVCVADWEAENNLKKSSSHAGIFRDRIRRQAGPAADISEEKLLIEKEITASDLSRNQGRLTLPVRKKREAAFLTAEEEGRLATRRDEKVGSLDDVALIPTVDDEVVKCEVSLRRWDLGDAKEERECQRVIHPQPHVERNSGTSWLDGRDQSSNLVRPS